MSIKLYTSDPMYNYQSFTHHGQGYSRQSLVVDEDGVIALGILDTKLIKVPRNFVRNMQGRLTGDEDEQSDQRGQRSNKTVTYQSTQPAESRDDGYHRELSSTSKTKARVTIDRRSRITILIYQSLRRGLDGISQLSKVESRVISKSGISTVLFSRNFLFGIYRRESLQYQTEAFYTKKIIPIWQYNRSVEV